MSKTSTTVRLGIFIVLGLVILVGFVYYIGANQNLFGSTTRLKTVFKNISGLQSGANVRFSGINVGTVDNIQILTDSTVGIEFIVESSASKYIKQDGMVSIASDGIMGDKVVNVTSGSAGKKRVKDGDLLKSVEPLEFDAIIAKAEQMASGLNTITENVADITSSIKQGRGTIGMLLYDQEMADRTRFLMTGLNRTVGSLNRNLKNTETGTAAFSENMKALQGNFLLKGYFKKKEKGKQDVEKERLKAAERIEGAIRDSVNNMESKKRKIRRKQARDAKRDAKRDARQQKKDEETQMSAE